jgi:phosphatidate cytidylyltransferase
VLRARLATAAVAIPLLLALIFWAPPWGMAVVVSSLALMAMLEYAGLAFAAQPRERALAVGLGSLVVLAGARGPDPSYLGALVTLPVIGFAYVVFARPDLERGLGDLGILVVGVLYIGLLMPHFIWLHKLPEGPAWVTFVIAVGMAGDTAGYFVGRALGRHKLIPRVSPGKTVEGAIGVVLGGVVAAAGAKVLFFPAQQWRTILALAVVMGVLGQVGDLSESVMKRAFGAKESGWIFPGHGGVLDRIDSLLFPVSLVYYYRLASL